MKIYWCEFFQCPQETRSLKPVTSMSMSEVLHELLLTLESRRSHGLKSIWHKDNEREQSWHEEIPRSQKLFISESRSTHRMNGKLCQSLTSGSLKTTLSHLDNVERVAVPKPGEVAKVPAKSFRGGQKSRQRNIIAVLGTCEHRGCEQHTWR